MARSSWCCHRGAPGESAELLAEACRNEGKLGVNRRKTWRRVCCRCLTLFLFLILTTAIIIVHTDLGLPLFTQTVQIFDFSIQELRNYEQYFVKYPYKYRFVINVQEKCKDESPFLVLMVPVAAVNREDRDTIRNTWGGKGLILGKVVSLVFLLGLPTGEGWEQVQQQVLQEDKEHGDLVQSDFVDSYRNLTIKTMVMMEWLDAHCSGASYAMKIDSDMFLNVHNLIKMLLKAPKSNYLTGLVERAAMVMRDPQSKWYIPEQVYPDSQYPVYALGLGYVLSLDIPRKLLEASRHVRPIYIEDVYLGLCMRYLGIGLTDPPDGNQFKLYPVPYNRCAYSKLIATTTQTYTDHIWIWRDFKKPGPFCIDT